jgi:ATP-binding cassette subfamily B protein
MNPDLIAFVWPASRFDDARKALEQESGALHIGLEALATEMSYADFERRLPTLGPALLQMPGEDGFLAILANSTLLSPDRTKVKIDLSAVRAALCSEMEAPVLKQIQETLELAEVPVSRQARARAAILRERFSAAPIPGIWLLRLPPSANFWLQLRQARVPQRLVTLAGAHALQYVLWILAWWMIGQNVFSGRGSRNWLVLWGLLLLSLVPIRVLITWLQGQIAIGAGARLKQRLFYGALRLEPDSIRHQGAGQLLGRVIESEAVEALALSGGFLGLVAIIELAILPA